MLFSSGRVGDTLLNRAPLRILIACPAYHKTPI